MKKTLLAICALALLGSNPAGAQANLNIFIALGDANTAGFAHGGLLDCYQENSWPALLARQNSSISFEMPLITTPGLPPLLQLVSLDEVAGQLVPTIVPIGDEPGLPYNAEWALPYNNLGIPGATLFDTLFTTGDIYNLLAGNTDNAMFDLILRIPEIQDPSTGQVIPFTAVTQAIVRRPTFVTVWVGNSDVFSAMYTATPIEGVTMTPVGLFAQLYPQLIGALVTQTSADVVPITLLDPTELPFATTVPPFIEIPGFGTVALMGEDGPLTADARLTFNAAALLQQGYGLPIPGSPPLPEDFDLATQQLGVILRPDEIAAIKDQVAAFNEIIRDTAESFGLAVFEGGAVVDRANTGDGYTYGAVEFNGEFLNGGFFGYDAIHMQQIGNHIFADQFIAFLSDEFGAGLPRINMAEIMYSNPCAITPEPTTAKAHEVVFSDRAQQQLFDILVPDVKAQSSERTKPRSRSRPRRVAPR